MLLKYPDTEEIDLEALPWIKDGLFLQGGSHNNWNIQEMRWLDFLRLGIFIYDMMDDGDQRIDELLCHIKEKKPDFCISLGDCCNPVDKNQAVLKKLESSGIPTHYVIGNHETDHCHMEEILKFYSLDSPYYSFVYGEYQFIVLDSCYWSRDRVEYPYYDNNYKEEGAIYPVIPADEMDWLEKALEHDKKYIIFSHHSLVNDFRHKGIYNRECVRNLFHGKQVILCMNGHDHGDDLRMADGIPFYTVNSASYVWAWGQMRNLQMSTGQVDHFNGILPYKQPLYVSVEIDEMEIRIKGMDGEYQSITPEDIGGMGFL